MVIIEDGLFVFANYISFVVLFDAMAGLGGACFWIVDRDDFLGCACLPASVDCVSFDWSKDAARSLTWDTGDESHNFSCSLRYCWGYDLLEHFRMPIKH